MAVTEAALAPAASDPTLQPFLQADFDPVAYLNSTLPTLTTSTVAARQQAHSANLLSLTNETQSLLGRLGAQTARLSSSLTQLTDEIIRSGGRLAYEVELLRGETISLSDALTTGLREEIEVFGPRTQRRADVDSTGATTDEDDNAYMNRLHVLSTVRQRLEAVIKAFDEAMKWPIAPSEVTAASSSIISIAAPSNEKDLQEQESKAQDFSKLMIAELEALTLSGTSKDRNPAVNRLDVMRELARIWSGTAEEKARLRQLEGFQRIVEDKQQTTARGSGGSTSAAPRAVDHRYGDLNERLSRDGSYDYLHSLRAGRE